MICGPLSCPGSWGIIKLYIPCQCALVCGAGNEAFSGRFVALAWMLFARWVSGLLMRKSAGAGWLLAPHYGAANDCPTVGALVMVVFFYASNKDVFDCVK